MSSLDNIVTEFNAIQAKFQAEVQDKLKVAFKEFFESYPEFQTIEWVQYSPYFNDGEECEFSVHEFGYTADLDWYHPDDAETIENRDYSPYELESMTAFDAPSDYERKSSYYKNKVAAWDSLSEEAKERAYVLNKAWSKFSGTLRSIPEDIYEATFGNHKQIRITLEGIEVTSYDHD